MGDPYALCTMHAAALDQVRLDDFLDGAPGIAGTTVAPGAPVLGIHVEFGTHHRHRQQHDKKRDTPQSSLRNKRLILAQISTAKLTRQLLN